MGDLRLTVCHPVFKPVGQMTISPDYISVGHTTVASQTRAEHSLANMFKPVSEFKHVSEGITKL